MAGTSIGALIGALYSCGNDLPVLMMPMVPLKIYPLPILLLSYGIGSATLFQLADD